MSEEPPRRFHALLFLRFRPEIAELKSLKGYATLPRTLLGRIPSFPGDELRVESEVLEVRPSKSRPNQGLLKVRTTTLNQDGDPVQVSVGNLVVPRRPT